jgi:trans-aconitate methyltransferase
LDLKEFDHSIADFDRHPWELARIEVVARLIKEFIPHRTSAVVLEIGCGDIFVLESLAEKFPLWSFVGTDIAFSESFLANYRHERIKVYKTSEEAMANITQHIDLVLLLDVIEHVPDDVRFLKSIADFHLVDPSTNFIITVPSFQWLFCSHDIFLQHYRRYSNNSLHALLQQVGMNVSSMGYFFASLLFTRMLRVSLENFKLIKPSQGLRNWRNTSLTPLLRFLLINDFKFSFAIKRLGIKIPGLSNYAICRRLE